MWIWQREEASIVQLGEVAIGCPEVEEVLDQPTVERVGEDELADAVLLLASLPVVVVLLLVPELVRRLRPHQRHQNLEAVQHQLPREVQEIPVDHGRDPRRAVQRCVGPLHPTHFVPRDPRQKVWQPEGLEIVHVAGVPYV